MISQVYPTENSPNVFPNKSPKNYPITSLRFPFLYPKKEIPQASLPMDPLEEE
jgi:hypothetical protein